MAYRPSKVRKPIGEEYKIIVYRQIDKCRRFLSDVADMDATIRSIQILKLLLDPAFERHKEYKEEYYALNKKYEDAIKSKKAGQLIRDRPKLMREYSEMKFSLLCRLAEATYGKSEYEEYVL